MNLMDFTRDTKKNVQLNRNNLMLINRGIYLKNYVTIKEAWQINGFLFFVYRNIMTNACIIELEC